MANQVTDNRTLVTNANAVGSFVDLSGAAAGTLDTEIFIQSTGSIGNYVSNTLTGILVDAGSAQNWANNTFYYWVNSGIVGLFDTKANGGFRIRFCGATVTNWFEVYVGGSDDWPAAISGGWTQFVVDIEQARATAITNGWTNGTVPATSAIRYTGYAAVTGGTMPRMADNTWLDEIRRLPTNTPGIIVEGRNGGTADWTSQGIFNALGVSVGTFVPTTGGAWKINTPIQFGINDSSTHAFSETNAVWLWDNQEFLPDTFYKISSLGGAGGTTNVTMGLKTGTLDDATGAQGFVIAAADGGARWSMDFDDVNTDGVGLYGCTFIGGNDFQFDDPSVSVISSTFLNCVSARIDNCADFLRNAVINSATADGTAFLTTDDLADLAFCDFEFSDGHAIELTSVAVSPQTSKGNTFSGYGADASNDAALYVSAPSGTLTVNITEQGDTPTERSPNVAVTIQNAVSITITVRDNVTGNVLPGASVFLEADTGGPLAAGTDIITPTVTNGSGQVTSSFAFTGSQPVVGAVRKADGTPRYFRPFDISDVSIESTGLTLNINLLPDE